MMKEEAEFEALNKKTAQRAAERMQAEAEDDADVETVIITAEEYRMLDDLWQTMETRRAAVTWGAVLALILTGIALGATGRVLWSWVPMLGAFLCMKSEGL